MKSLWTLVLAGALALAATGVARAGDDNPPPWRGLPNTTTQGWNFLNGPPDPSGQPNMTTLFHNPYQWPGAPFPHIAGGNWTFGSVPGTNIPAIVVGPGGSLDFVIPNNFDPTTQKEVWIQIKYFGVTPQVRGMGFDPNGNPMGLSFPAPGSPTFTPGPGPIPGSSEYTLRIRFDFNPAWEIISIFNNSAAGENMYIYQVVIDTICPTPGTAVAGLMGVGLLASRRRR